MARSVAPGADAPAAQAFAGDTDTSERRKAAALRTGLSASHCDTGEGRQAAASRANPCGWPPCDT